MTTRFLPGRSVRAALVLLAAWSSMLGGWALGDDLLVLRGKNAQLAITTRGGGIVEFRFLRQTLNPLNWDLSEAGTKPDDPPGPRGHFLCLDRWGAPSKAESDQGMPFHGEAPFRAWEVTTGVTSRDGSQFVEMTTTLPIAGLAVRREVWLDESAAVFMAREHVTNQNKLGRVYNLVQHPSIAPPFLDGETLVDSNATLGFVQESDIPDDASTAARWPVARIRGGDVDLRRFTNTDEVTSEHDVSSFICGGEAWGWVTAANPRHGLLIGYLWKSSEYPWLNIWRHREAGKIVARGLEFGTTGLHQPFPILAKRGRILGQPLFEYIDTQETASRAYVAFLAKIPSDYTGVATIRREQDRLELIERRDKEARAITVPMKFEL